MKPATTLAEQYLQHVCFSVCILMSQEVKTSYSLGLYNTHGGGEMERNDEKSKSAARESK